MRVAMLVALAIVAAGCGARSTPIADASAVQGSGAVQTPGTGTADPQDPGRVADAGTEPATAAEAGPGTERESDGSADADPVAPPEPEGDSAPPPPPADVPQDVVEATATVQPSCVRPGSDVTITVTTRPDAGVGYHAFYADGQGGGPPPYGASYGGNDGGLADADGEYTGSWTVAPNAPPGPGRVDVVVGHDGAFGETSVPFAVADAITGMCDR